MLGRVLAFIAGIIIAIAVRKWLRLPGPGPNEPEYHDDDPYRVAFLVEGRDGMLILALSELAINGNVSLKIHESTGTRVQQVSPQGLAEGSYLRFVYDSINYAGGKWRSQIENESPHSEPIRRELVQRKLVTSYKNWWLILPVPAFIASLVPALHLRWEILSGWEPFLAIGLAFFWPPHRTRKGDFVVDQLKKRFAHLEHQNPGQWRMAVALFGVDALKVNGYGQIAEALIFHPPSSD